MDKRVQMLDKNYGALGQTAQPLSRKSSGEVGGRGREMGGPDHPQGILLQNWGGTELNRTVTCIVLIAKANDRRKKSCL
ncbi:hypothetical protein TNCV_803881 [Trichonephila clavipes]|nr:hypothetical protein TNCV_803881 [Trichonephila clavipes]